MINPSAFLNSLKKSGVTFFAGVPDSLLKSLCACITDNDDKEIVHTITANEGAALAMTAGWWISTGKLGLCYLQNSGLGNLVNPALSLLDPDVYSIPSVLLIGWRGEPGVKDEPQHVKQGEKTLELLDVLGIPYRIVGSNDADCDDITSWAVELAKEKCSPVALVVRKDTFQSYSLNQEKSD